MRFATTPSDVEYAPATSIYLFNEGHYDSRQLRDLTSALHFCGAQLARAIELVRPYQGSHDAFLDGIRAKKWPTSVSLKLARARKPFLLFLDSPFSTFTPSKNEWAVLWTDKHEHQLHRFFRRLGNADLSNMSVFDYLSTITKDTGRSDFGVVTTSHQRKTFDEGNAMPPRKTKESVLHHRIAIKRALEILRKKKCIRPYSHSRRELARALREECPELKKFKLYSVYNALRRGGLRMDTIMFVRISI
jgi:hypothetical protein